MKTQTSKSAIWLRSLLLLPLLAGLLLSFSSTKKIEKHVETPIEDSFSTVLKTKHTARSIEIEVFTDGTYKIDGINATKNTFKQVINKLHQDITYKLRNKIINIHVDSPKDISNQEVWFIYNSVLDYGFHRIVTYNQEVIRSKGNKPFALENNKQKYVTKKPTLIVNGIVCDGCSLNLSKDGVKNIILSTTSGEDILSFKIKFPQHPTESIKGDALNNKAMVYLKKSNIGVSVSLFDIKTVKNEKLTPITITLVDKNDKNYSHSPKVVKGKKSTLPPPPPPRAPNVVKGEKSTIPPPPEAPKVVKGEKSNIPPPPPPPPAPKVKNIKQSSTGYIEISGETLYFSKQNGITKYYNRYGNEVDKNGKKLSNVQVDGKKVVKGQQISKVYKDDKVVSEFKKTWEDDTKLPPPPPPMTTTDHVIYMAKKGASFYYEGKSISSDKALDIVKKNSEINMSSKTTNGESIVNLSTSPINSSNMRRSKIMKERSQKLLEQKQKRMEALEKRKKERQIALEEIQIARKKEEKALEERKEVLKQREAILKERKLNNVAPKPTAGNIVSHIKVMNRHNATFYLNSKKVDYKAALKAVKKNKNADVNSTYEPVIVKITTNIIGVKGK